MAIPTEEPWNDENALDVVLERVAVGHRNEAESQPDLDIFGDAPRYAAEEAVAGPPHLRIQ